MEQPYKHWDGEVDRGTVVVKKKMNRVHIPDDLEPTKQNHIYTRTIDENGQPGMSYVAMPLEPQPFPKILFHPDFHKERKPIPNDFKQLGEYNAAMIEWEKKFERTVAAKDEKDEKRLLAKGWLPKAPMFAEQKAALIYDEI